MALPTSSIPVRSARSRTGATSRCCRRACRPRSMRSNASRCSARSLARCSSTISSSSSVTKSAASRVGSTRLASGMELTRRPNGSSGNILISSSGDQAGVVAREHRIFGLRPPASLREDAVMRHALAEYADLFQHPDAGVVLKRDVGFDAMQLEFIEAEGQQAQRDLRRQPTSGVAIVDAEADACNAGRRARQAAVSDDLPIGAQTPDEVEQAAPLAFAAILHVALHAPGAILEFGRLHRLTAHIGWARLERLHGRRILEAQFAQEKTGRLELRQHNVLRSSAPYLCRMRDSAGSKAKEGGGCLPLIVCSCSHTSYLSMIFLPKTGSHFRDHALAMEARHQTWRHLAGSNRLARSKRPTQLRHLAAVWRLADHAGWACGRGEPLAVGRRANHAARAFLDHRPLAVRPQPDAAARALLDDDAPAAR